MKLIHFPFLLITGNSNGNENWIGCYSSYEKAESKIIKTGNAWCPVKLNEPNSSHHNNEFEWYNIIDLRDWCERNHYDH